MALKLDQWKKVDGPELDKGVAKRHQGNEAAREQVRQEGNKITEAFRRISSENVGSPKEPRNADKILTKAENPDPRKKVEGPVVNKPPPKITKVSGEKPDSKSSIERNVEPRAAIRNEAPTNPPQNLSASSFVVGPKQAPLTDLLLKGSNVPKAPPQAKTPPQDAAENVVVRNDPRFQTPDGKNPLRDAKVPAPLAPQDGGATAHATLKQEYRDVGKKKDGKEKESGKVASGRGALTNREVDSAKGDAIEAAASGVGSDSEEDIANLAGIDFITEDPQNIGFHAVLARERLWNKILQLDRLSDREIAEIETALRANPDPELQRILKLGLSARKNVNGGMNA